jgi:hypothetical protein
MKSLIASRRLRQIMVLGVATSFAISSCGGSGDSTTDSSSAVSIDQPLHVVISEINYHDVSDTDANDFIELHNNHDDDGKVYWFPSIMDAKMGNNQEVEDLKLINS